MADATPPNYPSNSHKAKIEGPPASKEPERKKLAPVISGTAIERKKPFGKRLAETFTGDDARNVVSFIFMDVIVPAVKATITDVVSQGVERMIYGDVRRPQGGGPRPGYTNYNQISQTSQRPYEPARPGLGSARPAVVTQPIAQQAYNEIVLPSRGDGEMTISAMLGQIQQYGSVSVADFYELVGMTGSFTDQKWGWKSLSSAQVRPIRGGFLLDLPQPIVLD